MPRTSLASLGPTRFRPAGEPLASPAPLRTEVERQHPTLPGFARLTVVGLGIAGVLPPFAFTAHSAQLGLIGGVPVSIVLTGLLILAPALVCLVAALVGLIQLGSAFCTTELITGSREYWSYWFCELK